MDIRPPRPDSQPIALQRILYVSHLTRGSEATLLSTMEDIFLQSHHYNLREGITGFLWCDGHTFAQVIEGGEQQIAVLYARIAADSRHHQLRRGIDEIAPTRHFPRWTMCGMTLSEVDEDLLALADIEYDLFDAHPGAILDMLDRLSLTHGDQLDANHRKIIARAGPHG